MIGDPNVLYRSMRGLSLATAQRYAPYMNEAMLLGEITTIRRAQFWVGQLAHESGDLNWFEEFASGEAYEGRGDLGNTQPGDGRRFKGRGPIQLTGRHNYTQFANWLNDDRVLQDPKIVATPAYGFKAAIWYWTQARDCNAACDSNDYVELTRLINGGTNGLSDRWEKLRYVERLGNKILPGELDPWAVLTDVERSAVRRLTVLRERAEKAGGWGSANDPKSRKARAAATKALIRGVLMPRLRAAAKESGWDKGHRAERYDILGDAYGPPLRD